MFWNQSQAVNRAAKTIRSYLSENNMALTQSQALDLVARLQGFPNHMAANAALEESSKQEEVPLRSWNDLWQFIATMSEEQRKGSITVSEGCDENGNAEFFDASSIVRATASCIEAASDGVLESSDHVLLFNNSTELNTRPVTTFEDKARRFALQCQLADIASYSHALSMFHRDHQQAQENFPGMRLGDWVIFHDSDGYFNQHFGFVGDRGSATGWDTKEEAMQFMTNWCIAYAQSSEQGRANFSVLHCPGNSEMYPEM